MPERPSGSGGMYNSQLLGGHVIRAKGTTLQLIENQLYNTGKYSILKKSKTAGAVGEPKW